MLDQLEVGKFDIVINLLIVISSCIEWMEFMQLFFVFFFVVVIYSSSGLYSVLVFVKKFFFVNFIKVIFVLFIVIFIFGFIVWLFECKVNLEEFFDGWQGMWEGIWWLAVMMIMVGYGDKFLCLFGGRIVVLVWMFMAIIIIFGFMVSIVFFLMVNQLSGDIESLQELWQYEVGFVVVLVSFWFFEDNYVFVWLYNNVQVGLDVFEFGEIDVFVYDEFILKYEIFSGNCIELQVFFYCFNIQYYSYGLFKGSVLVDWINFIMFSILESS